MECVTNGCMHGQTDNLEAIRPNWEHNDRREKNYTNILYSHLLQAQKALSLHLPFWQNNMTVEGLIQMTYYMYIKSFISKPLTGTKAGWMICGFRSFSTAFHSYHEDDNEKLCAMDPVYGRGVFASSGARTRDR